MMYITLKEFSELLNKVAQTKAANSGAGTNTKWNVEDLAIIFSTTAEDIGLTLTFIESSGLINQKEETNE